MSTDAPAGRKHTAIQIRPEFSLVELPVDLPDDVLDRLSGTRISGRLIELRPDTGPSRRADRGDGDRSDRGYGDRPDRGNRTDRDDGGKPFRKPRHKS